jgi:anti-sigma B factor antagonist
MIELSTEGKALVIKVTETQLQMYAIPQFKTMVIDALHAKPPLVVFDMETVDHVDSSALGALLHFQKHIQAYNGKMALANVTPKVMQVIKVTKFENNLQIFDSVAEAAKI